MIFYFILFYAGSEIDQLYKICRVLGTPDWNIFPEATNISRLLSVSYSEVNQFLNSLTNFLQYFSIFQFPFASLNFSFFFFFV